MKPVKFSLITWLSITLLSGCSLLTPSSRPATDHQSRVQGMLEQKSDGSWQLNSCWDQPPLTLSNADLQAISQGAPEEIIRSGSFFDSSGRIEQQFTPSTLHRLQAEGHDCTDPKFKQLFFRAYGNEPSWMITLEKNGLLFEQFNQPAVAIPFIETTLPSGAISISSSDPQINFQLLLTPAQCIDSMSGTTSAWQAKVQFAQAQQLQGCAYPGLQRQ
ncbi:COG3650 family protein [Thiopseudomonas alkaliphila]|uniref:COG3650 family protein n=1 Tax=Thiopseudomonas alkaliphila TaxID=1697053 RepID=UPI0025787255|nr:hypothetical protein [Thiopseudomonas alkaliphila]MDM1707010.1 hypothetical protein [Thiopseudomonas alkaliphila]